VATYADRIGADHIVQREPILRIAPLKSARSENALRLGYLPIYEKENAFQHLGDYDQVLILDADVYVTGNAPDIFAESVTPFAGVIEREMPLTVQYRRKVQKHSEGQFRSLSDVDWLWDDFGADYFNMGVMLLHKDITAWLNGDSPKQFIRRPEFERFVNGEGHWRWSTDQTLLNYWLKRDAIPVTRLDWRWNAMYGALVDVSEAYFVHFFLSAKFPRRGAEIPDIIKSL
jgi:lipopolysaccharide biosynthesis glycosyltransferase